MAIEPLFNIVSAIGFAVAFLLVLRIQKNLIGHPARVFLCVFLGIYFLVQLSSLLQQGGIGFYLERYQYYAEFLFPPLFLFFIFPAFALYVFSMFMRQDLERRMQIEASLRESEDKFKSLTEQMADGVAVVIGGRTRWVNPAFAEIFGRQVSDLLDLPLASLASTGGVALLQERAAARAAGRKLPTLFEMEARRHDGRLIVVEVSETEIVFEGENALQVLLRDVTDRKRAEEAVWRAKEEWERTFDTVPDHIAILDARHRIVRINRSLADRLGVEPTAAQGQSFHTLVHGLEEAQPTPMPGQVAEEAGLDSAIELYEERPDGSHFLVTVTPLTDSQGGLAGSVRVARDITEIKRVERELAATRAFLQSVLDGVTDSIMVVGLDYRVHLLNRTAAELHAAGPADGSRSCHEISHHRSEPCSGEEHPCPLRAVVASREPVTVIHTHTRADGAEYVVEIAASPIVSDDGQVSGIIEVGRDITEKLRLEKERRGLELRLFQAQKDQSIATLAAGIAHDFNNQLATVIGNAELLEMPAASHEHRSAMTAAILGAAQRMTELTAQLLAYARTGAREKKVLSLNEMARQILEVEGMGQGLPVESRLELAPDLWPVTADSDQIAQVLTALFANAFEAMDEEGGTLTVRTANLAQRAEWVCDLHNAHPAGDYVLLEVADTGPGIAEEVRSRIFEPFVTTRALGRGLGLAAVAGIIQHHGGCVAATSRPGEGAVFRVHLPRAEESGPGEEAAQVAALRPRGRVRIMVLDGEPQVRLMLRNALAAHGFSVVSPASPREAMDILTSRRQVIDLAILDIRMRGRNGRVLFHEIKALRPDLPLLTSSGYDAATALAGITLTPDDGFIQKPYRQADLIAKVNDLLEGSSSRRQAMVSRPTTLRLLSGRRPA
ncbi:MAG: PAS domain S-box protein [Thermodesulfobacteriota bacterium]